MPDIATLKQHRAHWRPMHIVRASGRRLVTLPSGLAAVPGRAGRGLLRSLRDLDDDEGGQTLPFLAMTVFTLALSVFMVIHLGTMLTAKMQTQIGTDSAALTNAVWIARTMNLQSHLNISLMLWMTNHIIFRAFWMTCVACTLGDFLIIWNALWIFVCVYTGQCNPLSQAWQDYPDLLEAAANGFIDDMVNGDDDYYGYYETATNIEDGIDDAAWIVAGAMATFSASDNGVMAYSMSVGDERYPYETGDWHRLCHNNGPTGDWMPSGDGSGMKEGDLNQGGWFLRKHGAIGAAAGSIASFVNQEPNDVNGFASVGDSFLAMMSGGGPLWSEYIAAVIISFTQTGLYNLAHIKFLMELPTWYAIFCPDPGMNPAASVPGISATEDTWFTGWWGRDPEEHSTGTIENEGEGADLLDAFGVGGLLENFNEWFVSFNWDPPEPRYLRDNWDEVRFYTALGTSHSLGPLGNVQLPGESSYFDMGTMGDIGIWTFAEAEVYNPHIAAGNSMEQVIGMYSPNWRARLRPFDFDHFNANLPISIPFLSEEYLGNMIQH